MVKRINISISDHLYERLTPVKDIINLSKICQKALSQAIRFQETKWIYQGTGFKDGKIRAELLSEFDNKKIIDVLQGCGRYGHWNEVERIHEIYERYVDPEVERCRFGNMENGALLLEKGIGIMNGDEISEAFYEYKKGWCNGVIGKNVPKSPKVQTELTKSKALSIVNDTLLPKYGVSLNSKQLIFSNKNKANDKWWFEPAYSKFYELFYVALNDSIRKLIYLFKIPENEFLNYRELFRDRPQKKRCSITIEGDDNKNFQDTNSGSANVNFKKYLLERIEYENIGKRVYTELHDPIEDDPETKAIIEAAHKEAESELANSKYRNKMGFCHMIWMIQAGILKDKYGIEWKSPAEMNPHVMYD